MIDRDDPKAGRVESLLQIAILICLLVLFLGASSTVAFNQNDWDQVAHWYCYNRVEPLGVSQPVPPASCKNKKPLESMAMDPMDIFSIQENDQKAPHQGGQEMQQHGGNQRN